MECFCGGVFDREREKEDIAKRKGRTTNGVVPPDRYVPSIGCSPRCRCNSITKRTLTFSWRRAGKPTYTGILSVHIWRPRKVHTAATTVRLVGTCAKPSVNRTKLNYLQLKLFYVYACSGSLPIFHEYRHRSGPMMEEADSGDGTLQRPVFLQQNTCLPGNCALSLLHMTAFHISGNCDPW